MKSKNRDFFLEALKIQKNAKRIGFDWQKKEEIFKKIREEIRELKRAIKKGDQKMVEEEFGDLLFSLINLSRHLRINPKIALRKANQKFLKRFQEMKKKISKNATLQEMDRVWEMIKRR